MTQIINKIQTTLQTSPNECFILEGYSQGAAATVNALPRLTGASFTAVKGVFLIGDPQHKSGLVCNVDNNNGTTTRNVNGLSAAGAAGIPSNWISKTLDVCIYVSYSLLNHDRNSSADPIDRATAYVTPPMAKASTCSTCNTPTMLQPRGWEPATLKESCEELRRSVSAREGEV